MVFFNREVCKVYAKTSKVNRCIALLQYKSVTQGTLISDLKPVTKNYFFLSHYMPVAYGFAFLTPIYIAVQPK